MVSGVMFGAVYVRPKLKLHELKLWCLACFWEGFVKLKMKLVRRKVEPNEAESGR